MLKMGENSIEGRRESLTHTGASHFGDSLAINFSTPNTPPQVVYHAPGGYNRPYGTYGDLTGQFPASNSKKKWLSLAWPYINGL